LKIPPPLEAELPLIVQLLTVSSALAPAAVSVSTEPILEMPPPELPLIVQLLTVSSTSASGPVEEAILEMPTPELPLTVQLVIVNVLKHENPPLLVLQTLLMPTTPLVMVRPEMVTCGAPKKPPPSISNTPEAAFPLTARFPAPGPMMCWLPPIRS